MCIRDSLGLQARAPPRAPARGQALQAEPGHKQSSGLFVPGERPVPMDRRGLQGEGSRVAAVSAGAPFFAYFLWQDKESRWPPAAMERERSCEASLTPERAQRATARNTTQHH